MQDLTGAGKKKALSRVKGVFYAVLSSVSFGFSPLFSLVLIAYGLNNFDVLTYRWGIAAIGMLAVTLISRKTLALKKNELWKVILLSIFRAVTSITLLVGYVNISSGVAQTINFMYPVFVASFMMMVGGEKKSPVVMASILASIAGVYLIATGDDIQVEGGNTLLGLICSIVSALAYSGYFILVKVTKADKIEGMKFTTWMMALCCLYFLVGGLIYEGRINTLEGPFLWGNLLALGLWSTMITNFATVKAIRRIGPTLSSIFGALQPVTACILGVIFINEHFTSRSLIGIILILVTVSIVTVYQRNRN